MTSKFKVHINPRISPHGMIKRNVFHIRYAEKSITIKNVIIYFITCYKFSFLLLQQQQCCTCIHRNILSCSRVHNQVLDLICPPLRKEIHPVKVDDDINIMLHRIIAGYTIKSSWFILGNLIHWCHGVSNIYCFTFIKYSYKNNY